jgi:hypothetical protein
MATVTLNEALITETAELTYAPAEMASTERCGQGAQTVSLISFVPGAGFQC